MEVVQQFRCDLRLGQWLAIRRLGCAEHREQRIDSHICRFAQNGVNSSDVSVDQLIIGSQEVWLISAVREYGFDGLVRYREVVQEVVPEFDCHPSCEYGQLEARFMQSFEYRDLGHTTVL